MDNKNRDGWRESLARSLNKEPEKATFSKGIIDTTYFNYIKFSKVLNNTNKVLKLYQENLQILREQILNYKKLIEILQQESSSADIKDNDREEEIEKDRREIEVPENKIKETEREIEILEIQKEALESTVKKEREILLNAGVELPEISENDEQQGNEHD